MGVNVNAPDLASSTSATRLRAGIVVVSPAVDTRVSFARGDASAVQPSAQATCVVPLAEISYILLNASAYLDESGRFKYLTEIVAVTDKAALLVSKTASDAVGLSDFSFREAAKVLKDSVSFTEVFSRTLIFIRNLADTLGTTEKVALQVVKPLLDSVASSDASFKTIYKTLADAFAMNDSFDTSDGAQWSFTKSINNVALVSDTLTRSLTKALTDAFTTSEQVSRSVSKLLTDSYAVTDFLTKTYAAAETDSFTATDQPFKAVNKSLTGDTVNTSDTTAKTPLKLLKDSSTTADSGYLYSQGYCDITYFAEDYVGSYRTF